MYQSTVGKIPIAIILVTLKGCWNIQGSGAGYITQPASNLVLKPYPALILLVGHCRSGQFEKRTLTLIHSYLFSKPLNVVIRQLIFFSLSLSSNMVGSWYWVYKHVHKFPSNWYMMCGTWHVYSLFWKVWDSSFSWILLLRDFWSSSISVGLCPYTGISGGVEIPLAKCMGFWS